jgi:ribulose-5-phosphate 4-epimerase/fuculose-1-phosphate aldolase
MADLDALINELVLANRILAGQGVVDAFGHVSVRHPEKPDRFFLSRSRSPELVEHEDIMEFGMDGQVTDGRTDPAYHERFIHAAVYEANPHINAVVHSHALDVLPFTISSVPLRPCIHTASQCGETIPVWDIHDTFGDTGLLVTNMDHGRDLAKTMGSNRVALMRGHGFTAAGRTLGEVLKSSIYLPQNAKVLKEAMMMGGTVKVLSAGEIAVRDADGPGGKDLFRAIAYWASKAGCSHLLQYKKK